MKRNLKVSFGFVVLCCLFLAAVLAAQQTPRPDADFRKAELPADFTVPAHTKFVDAQHPDALDKNPGTPEKPWKTIQHAADSAGPGDTIIIRGGIYRELVTISNSGQPQKPITFRSVPGERVQINGAELLTGWRRCTPTEVNNNPNAENIFMVDLPWTPDHMYEKGYQLVNIASTPNSGWFGITKGLSLKEFTDTVHLKAFDNLDGWQVRILEQTGGQFNDYDIAGFDKATGKITLTSDYSSWRKIINEKRDRYMLVNHLSTLDGPGQFVIRKKGKGCRLFLWPARPGKNGEPVVEAQKRSYCIDITGKNHVILDGLEVTLSKGIGIGESQAKEGEGFTVQNCYVHHNRGYGINKRSGANFTVRRCVIKYNWMGVVMTGTKNGLIEENEVGLNYVDGLIAAGNVFGHTIRRNYVYSHYKWGHPDNIQFWNNVNNVTIQDNVFLHSGQAMMSQEMRGNIRLINNYWLGTHAVAMIVGAAPPQKDGSEPAEWNTAVEIKNNTAAMTANPTNWSGKNYKVSSNIFARMKPGFCMALPDPQTCTADYDLFWGGEGYKGALATSGGWSGPKSRGSANTIEQMRKKLKIEAHGNVGNPKFRNAPAYYAVTHYGKVSQCTPSKLVLKDKHPNGFKVGDNIELDFEGVLRKVTSASDEVVEFEPALPQAPITTQTICNWKDKTDFTLDLRLADDSPYKGKGEDGKDPGCNLDIQAYKRGDFDNDGKRDLPTEYKD